MSGKKKSICLIYHFLLSCKLLSVLSFLMSVLLLIGFFFSGTTSARGDHPGGPTGGAGRSVVRAALAPGRQHQGSGPCVKGNELRIACVCGRVEEECRRDRCDCAAPRLIASHGGCLQTDIWVLTLDPPRSMRSKGAESTSRTACPSSDPLPAPFG